MSSNSSPLETARECTPIDSFDGRWRRTALALIGGALVGCGANETLTQRFSTPGEFESVCTVHPSGQVVLTVNSTWQPAPSPLAMVSGVATDADAAFLLVGVELAVWGLFTVPASPCPLHRARFTGRVDRPVNRCGQRFQGAVGLTAPGPPVSTSAPSSVTKTVCSYCAVRWPSAVTAVQSSSHTL